MSFTNLQLELLHQVHHLEESPPIAETEFHLDLPIDDASLAPSEVAPQPRIRDGRNLLQRILHHRQGLTFSLLSALIIHASLITAGLILVGARRFTPPQLILPYGWASDLDGAGPSGAAPLLAEQQLILPPPPGAPAEEPASLAPPPDTSLPQVQAAPPVTLPLEAGTIENGALVRPATDDAAPLLNFHPLPAPFASGSQSSGGTSSASNNASALPNADSQTRATGTQQLSVQNHTGRPADTSPPGSGRGMEGTGTGNGGAPAGVAEGQPIPAPMNKPPLYPPLALRRGWSGTVVLEMDLDASGDVSAVRIIQSSGHDILDKAAADAAARWRFTPAKTDGKPVPITVRRDINFVPPR